MPRIWDDRLAEVWAPPGKAGAGVVLGQNVVLTVRHVIEGALSGGGVMTRVVRPGGEVSMWARATIAAEDSEWDLAVLIADQSGSATSSDEPDWLIPASEMPVIARTGSSAEPGCESVGFPQTEVQLQSSDHGLSAVRQTEQVRGTLLPVGQGRPPSAPGRVLPRRWMPLDAETATPLASDGWGGMSGAGVILRNGHLVGVVVTAEADHQQRRLYVVPLAEAIDQSTSIAAAFASAITGTLVIESPTAVVFKGLLERSCLGQDGAPLRLADADLSAFGVKRAGIAGESSYLDYVSRDYDPKLRQSLEYALSDQKMVLVVGGSAGGKSRSAAEMAVRLFGQRRLLCPRSGSLTRLADVEGADFGNSVVWLDDIERFDERTFKDAVVRLLEQGALVVSTIRRTEIEARMPRGEIRDQFGDALMNPDVVQQVDWPTKWSDRELNILRDNVTDESLLGWVAGGNSPSAWIVAGPALAGKMRMAAEDDERPSRYALMRAVLDWFRIGVMRSLSRETAAQLASSYLIESSAASDLDEAFSWALEPVIGAGRSTAQALLAEFPGNAGIAVHDYVQDADRKNYIEPIPDFVFDVALSLDITDDQRFGVGISAALQGSLQVAGLAWLPLAEGGDTQAMANLLLAFKDSDPAEAARWGELAAETGDAAAMFNLGYLFSATDSVRSRHWYERAAAVGHIGAMVNLAFMISASEPEEARRWYDRAIEAGNVDAMNNLAFIVKDSEPELAIELWERAAGAGSLEAKTSLGIMVVDSDPERARDLWQEAAGQGFGRAMLNLGLFLLQTDLETGTYWLIEAAAAGIPGALSQLGILGVTTAPDEARLRWERAADAGDVSAMFNLWAFLRGSEPEQAHSWLETAAEAGMPQAMYNLGAILKDSDPVQARNWLERGANAGSVDAMVGLGILTSDAEPQAARDWYEKAASQGRVEAMVGLGGLLKATNPGSAKMWWERAAERGSTAAMFNLAMWLRESDPEEGHEWLRRFNDAGGQIASS